MKNSRGLFGGGAYYPLVFLFYLGLLASLFPEVLFLDASFLKRDILRYYFPVWRFGADSLAQGTLPLWNPYNSYGVPFAANIQSCVFYPFQILLHLPSYLWGFNFYILLHAAMAGFFTCLWVRDCGVSRIGAFLSGFSFMLSGYVMSTISLTISLCSLAYFPLILLCLRRAFRSHSFRWYGLGSLVLLFQYLAGDPAVFISTLLVCTVFTLYRTAAESFSNRRFVMKYFLGLSGMGLIFLGLSAFQSLLFAEFLSLSNRSEPSFDTVTMWSMQYNDLLSFIFPFFSDVSLFFMDYWVRQSWLENAYLGITVFLLAGCAWRYRKSSLVGYHILLALFGLGLALGRFCYLYQVLYDWFPFFKFIRYPARLVYMTHFAMACLAGFGLDAVLAAARVPKTGDLLISRQAKLFSLFLVLAAAAVLLSMGLSPWISGSVYERLHPWITQWSHLEWRMDQVIDMVIPVLANAKRFTVLALFILAGVFIARHLKVREMILAVFFCLLVFVDLVQANIVEIRVFGTQLGPAGHNMRVIMKDAGVYRAQASPSVSNFHVNPPSTYNLEQMFYLIRESLTPNLLLPHRIFYTAGYDSLYIKEVFQLNSRGKNIIHPAKHRYLDMLNIKYTVSMRKELDESYRLLRADEPFYLYSNDRVLERAFLVPSALKVDLPEKILNRILSKSYEPTARLYLQEDPPSTDDGPPLSIEAVPGRVAITRYSPNEVEMTVSSPKSQWLFFSDLFYPGWKAFVNGRPVKIYKANYAFRAVWVPAGASDVRWKYEPVLFKIGVGISAVTAAVLGLYFLRRKRGVSG